MKGEMKRFQIRAGQATTRQIPAALGFG